MHPPACASSPSRRERLCSAQPRRWPWCCPAAGRRQQRRVTPRAKDAGRAHLTRRGKRAQPWDKMNDVASRGGVTDACLRGEGVATAGSAGAAAGGQLAKLQGERGPKVRSA